MKVETVMQLRESIENRGRLKAFIRKEVNVCCQERFGIEDFWSTVDQYLPKTSELGLCLVRQVPTANVEHIALALFCEWLSSQGIPCRAMPLSVTRDSYRWQNAYKHSLVKVPFLSRDIDGELKIQNQGILPKSEKRGVDGKILEHLKTVKGNSLPEYHSELRKRVFGSDDRIMANLSDFFINLLSQSAGDDHIENPKTIFKEHRGREIEYPFDRRAFLLPGESIRPPASWYYIFYMMLFLTGERVLISTVSDDEKVSGWFNDGIEVSKDACGFEPIIINSPNEVGADGHKSNLLEMPQSFIEHGLEGLRSKISMPRGDCSLFAAMESIERQIIELA
jgi:hypothetical protein